MTPAFRGGHNIAMKLPSIEYDNTVAFYRDTLGMDVREHEGYGTVTCSAAVAFGPITLWLDRVDNYASAGVWLELFTDDVELATRHLAANGVLPQDELEPMPSGMNAHWITNPAMVPHIVRRPD